MTFYLSTETIPLPFPTTKISFEGFDIDKKRNWIAIVESEAGLRLRTSWSDISLPVDLPYASVRWLDDKALVVFSRISEADETNAWIIDPQDGAVLKAFSIGDGVQDVLVLTDFIAVSYFDEGVFSSVSGPSHEGLAVFGLDGTYLWGYMSSVNDAVDIADCYAMCPLAPNRLAFYAYTNFDWVELDLESRSQKVVPIPQQPQGSGAITYHADIAFFVGPYPDTQDFSKPRDKVFAFNRVTGTVSEAPSISGKALRGMPDGRLLGICEEGLVIAAFI